MYADEQAIIDYLKSWPHSFVSIKEISRKVGGRERHEEDRGWALPVLTELVQKGIVESDFNGHYRLKQEDHKKKRSKTHVSPQLLRILKSSGKTFDGISIDEADGPPVYRKPTAATPREGEKRD